MRFRTLSSLAFLLASSSCSETKTANDYLQEANSYLVSGKFSDALNSYSNAIDADPENYSTYFKRATAYMTLGKNQAALQDFSQILQIKPDFDKALFHRGKLYIKVGQVDDALTDLNKYLKINSENSEVKELIESVEKYNENLKTAEKSLNNQDYQAAIDSYSECLRLSPQSLSLRRLRAKTHLKLNQIEEAAGDWTVITHLNPMDKSSLLQLSKINYFMLYQPEPALQNIKKYLHYDPEDKEFKTLFRLLKKYEKKVSKLEENVKKRVWTSVVDTLQGTEEEKGLYDDIISTLDGLKESMQVSSFGPDKLRGKLYTMECQAHSRLRNKNKTIEVCSKAIEFEPENTQIIVARGDGYMALDDYENAVKDYTTAFEKSGNSDKKIHTKLQKAKQELKRSKQRDYYKILNVNRDATQREIKKAYNKVARELHPDKYRGDLSEEEVLAKMSEVNQAYEVLKDEELRARFDRGDDPNDSQARENPFAHHGGGHQFFFQGGNPFGSGGNPFGGAHFKFDF